MYISYKNDYPKNSTVEEREVAKTAWIPKVAVKCTNYLGTCALDNHWLSLRKYRSCATLYRGAHGNGRFWTRPGTGAASVMKTAKGLWDYPCRSRTIHKTRLRVLFLMYLLLGMIYYWSNECNTRGKSFFS